MLACVARSKVFGYVEEHFLQEIADLAQACGFKHKDGQQLEDIFKYSEFCDWDFSKASPDLCTPQHKLSIRKLLAAANKVVEPGEIATAHETHSERGRREFIVAPEKTVESEDQIEMFGKLLERCTKRAKEKEIHIETANELRETCGSWGDATHSMLPASEGVNSMAKDLEKVRTLGVKQPFVRVSIVKFLPEWYNEKRADGYLLAPQLLGPSLARWAIAAQANKMVPMHVGFAHMDICMRVAEEAKIRNKHICTAAAYDDLRQKTMAEMCLKGVSGFDVCQMLTTFDREVFERACQTAENLPRTTTGKTHVAGQWKSDSWQKDSWQQNGKWSSHSHQKSSGKRAFEYAGKSQGKKQRY